MWSNKQVNLLFVCSRNRWRSPTAEAVWRKKEGFNARSAGTSPRAIKTISSADIRWADMIFAMEQKHKNRIKAEFTRLIEHKLIYVLDIPDAYKYMDKELIAMIEISVGSHINK